MSKEEIWKPIKGYEGLYEVSNLGRVKSLGKIDSIGRFYKERILKAGKNKDNGYPMVQLFKDGKGKTLSIHRLVALAFIPNPDNKPCIDHINTIKFDNRAENLRWVTRKENNLNPLTRQHQKDSWKNPITRNKHLEYTKTQKIPIVQLNKDYSFVRYWDSASDVERELGYSNGNINKCLKGKRKYANGFIWRFKEEYDFRELIRLGMDNRKGVA